MIAVIRKRLVFYPKKCIGCRLCEVSCVNFHEDLIKPANSRIRIIRDHENQKEQAIYCHFCTNTPCIEACPENAIYIDEDIPCLKVVKDKCTGCESCIEVCPFSAPIINQDSYKILICDLCEGNPSCVEICPEHAILYK